jgi:phosphatidylserine decarboxylase
VAAVLVASMRFHAVDVLLNLRYQGPNDIPCDAIYTKGQEMGWFEHGSTLLLFVPQGYSLAEGIESGKRLRMGEALLVKQSALS